MFKIILLILMLFNLTVLTQEDIHYLSRPKADKNVKMKLSEKTNYSNLVIVKFVEGSMVRIRNGELTSLNNSNIESVNKLLKNKNQKSK